MGEFGTDGRPVAKTRDPLVKFLGGCAIVAALFVALFLSCAWYVGWRLTQDPAPGRPPEAFLTGDETRYWCIDLKPDDRGLQAFFQNLEQVSEESRRAAVKGTFLESFPLPRRRAHLDELAPLTLEGSMFAEPDGWAVRATLSHQVLKMRAVLKLMRWMMSRNADKAKSFEVDGISVTEVHDKGVGFTLANAGNRVVAASDATRMRQVLGAAASPPHPEVAALHRAIAQDGEDGWAFIANTEIASLPSAMSIAAAAASFDVTPEDDLVFRVAVKDAAAAPERRAFQGSLEDCRAVAVAFLPMLSAEHVEIDGGGAQPSADGSRAFTGRLRNLTKRFPDALRRKPSASPSPPSPPSSGDPRSDTPAAPTHEGNPKPPR